MKSAAIFAGCAAAFMLMCAAIFAKGIFLGMGVGYYIAMWIAIDHELHKQWIYAQFEIVVKE